MADLQDQIDALVAQLAAVQAQPPQQPQAQPQVGPFALTPATATQNVIDLTHSSGIKLYKVITTPLETKYDGSTNKLLAFLTEIELKAANYGWNDALLLINDQNPVTPQERNLLQNHRLLTIANVRAHAAAYTGTQTRIAQDASMMFAFLRDSLTGAARSRMDMDTAKYSVNGTRDGPCYLKALMIKFYVETKATNFHLRQKFQHLSLAMIELKYDVPAFNDYVVSIIHDLAKGGQTCNDLDLLIYIFDSYLKVKDKEFHGFIQRKKEAYNDGTEDITVETLMDFALVKYNQLEQSKKLNPKALEQEQLFALMAQLNEKGQAKSTFKPKALQSIYKDKGTTREVRSKDVKEDKRKYKAKVPKKTKLPAWRYERNGGKTSLVKDGKTWTWCDHHAYWCEHATSQCRAKGRTGYDPTDDKTVKTKNRGHNNPTSALSIARALVSITEDDDYSSEDDL